VLGAPLAVAGEVMLFSMLRRAHPHPFGPTRILDQGPGPAVPLARAFVVERVTRIELHYQLGNECRDQS